MRTPPTAPRHRRTGLRRRIVAAAGITALVGAGIPGVLAALPAAAAQAGSCMAADGSDFIGLHGAPTFTDNNVTTYVGGDAQFLNAENEGLQVVTGDLLVDRAGDGEYNMAYVGVGSQSLPADGELMLAVGGNLTIAPGTTIPVGAAGAVTSPVGAYMIGGSITPPSSLTSGIPLPYDLTGTPAEGFGARVAAASDAWDATPVTGTATASGPGEWDALVLAGDSTSPLQHFRVDAAALVVGSGASATPRRALDLTGVPAGASIVITVTGGPTATLPSEFSIKRDGAAADYPSPAWASLTQHLVWHFPTQTSVEIGTANSQMTGSILVANPSSTTEAATSLNGRVYTAGDFVIEGGGVEIHSFPFKGHLPFDCLGTSSVPTPTTTTTTSPATTVPTTTAPATTAPTTALPTTTSPTPTSTSTVGTPVVTTDRPDDDPTTPPASGGTTDPGTTDPGTTDPGTTGPGAGAGDPGDGDPATTTGPGTVGDGDAADDVPTSAAPGTDDVPTLPTTGAEAVLGAVVALTLAVGGILLLVARRRTA